MEGTKLVAKKLKYTPINEIISIETVFVQAATALDLAAQYAEEIKDAGSLVAIAQVWVEMGASLIAASGEEEEEELDLTSKNQLGFESESMEQIRKAKEEDDRTEDKLPHVFWMKPVRL